MGPLVLSVRPCLYVGVNVFFEPLVGIFHSRAVVFVRNRFLRSLYRGLGRKQID